LSIAKAKGCQLNIRITAGNFTEMLGEAELEMFSQEKDLSQETTAIDSPFLRARIDNIRSRDLSISSQSYRPTRDLEIASDEGHPRLSVSLSLEGDFLYRWEGMAHEEICRAGTIQIWTGDLPGYCRFGAGSKALMSSVTASEGCLDRLCSAFEGMQLLTGPRTCTSPFALLPRNVPIPPRVLSVFQALRESDLMGNAAGLYRDAKLMELFSLVLEIKETEGVERLQGRNGCVQRYDVERLREARAILLRRLLDPPSIPELARLVGINECKLKKGFRELFGNSIYGLLFSHRMELARGYLQETDKSVQEIAGLCGYEHVSHFSTAFRRGTGASPVQFRKSASGGR